MSELSSKMSRKIKVGRAQCVSTVCFGHGSEPRLHVINSVPDSRKCASQERPIPGAQKWINFCTYFSTQSHSEELNHDLVRFGATCKLIFQPFLKRKEPYNKQVSKLTIPISRNSLLRCFRLFSVLKKFNLTWLIGWECLRFRRNSEEFVEN